MKRTILFVACAALALAACSTSSGSPSATTGAASSKHYKIYLVTGDDHDPFYVTMNQGAQAEAKKLGVTVIWQGPAQFEAQLQIPILDSVLAAKPNFLINAPDDVKALIQPLEQFKAAGIPVITVDTDVNNHSVRLANLTSDNILGGQLAAAFLNKALGGHGKVMYVGEQPGVFTTDERQKGFEQALKTKYTGLTYIGPQFNNDDPSQVTSVVSAELQRNPGLKGIFASDTANGQGAAVAVQNAGLTGKVKIVAFDAEPSEVQALEQGTIQALIVQKAYEEGMLAVKYAVQYLNGNHNIPPETTPSYVIATPANIHSPAIAIYIYHAK